MPRITDSKGRVYQEGHSDYDKVRIDNLEGRVRDLTSAVVELQHRLSRLDGEDLVWPGGDYEPFHTEHASYVDTPTLSERVAALEKRTDS
jgi:hypothetical protein